MVMLKLIRTSLMMLAMMIDEEEDLLVPTTPHLYRYYTASS